MTNKIKSNELINAIENFTLYRYTPSDEGIHYGCDCGCGGDYYSRHPKEWDEDHKRVYKYKTELKYILEKLGIEIDTPELVDDYNSEDGCNMKIKDLLYTYKNKLDNLEKIAKDYYDTHYCGHMGEWVNDGSEEEYLKLRQNVIDYLDSEVKL